MKAVLFGVALAALSAVPALGQIETVVVSGERSSYSSDAPGVTVVERADHLVAKVRVTCDTRDAQRRKDELRQTLKDMIAAAKRTDSISLGIGDEILYEFKESSVDKIIRADTRSDTSDAYVVVRTELSKSDTFEAATQRIRDFIAHTPMTGRTEIPDELSFNLGLMRPERYRTELISKIAEDSKRTAALFGPTYQVRIEGLQRSIQWFQSGQLDLSLYISYGLVVSPNGAQ
jgi:hypothetical protein